MRIGRRKICGAKTPPGRSPNVQGASVTVAPTAAAAATSGASRAGAQSKPTNGSTASIVPKTPSTVSADADDTRPQSPTLANTTVAATRADRKYRNGSPLIPGAAPQRGATRASVSCSRREHQRSASRPGPRACALRQRRSAPMPGYRRVGQGRPLEAVRLSRARRRCQPPNTPVLRPPRRVARPAGLCHDDTSAWDDFTAHPPTRP